MMGRPSESVGAEGGSMEKKTAEAERVSSPCVSKSARSQWFGSRETGSHYE